MVIDVRKSKRLLPSAKAATVTGSIMSALTRWHAPFTIALLHMVSDVWNLSLWYSATDFQASGLGSQVQFTPLRARGGKSGIMLLLSLEGSGLPHYT